MGNYSAEQNGEIKDAKSFETQAFIFVGGSSSPAFCWPLAAAFQTRSRDAIPVRCRLGLLSGVSEANIAGFNLWPPILAVALRQPDGDADRRRIHPQQLPYRQ